MPTCEQLHPAVLQLQREDSQAVRVLAALARRADTEGTLKHLTDAELASHLLILQDAGFLTLMADNSGRLSYELHGSNRRERRQKMRSKKNRRRQR